jgi:hypothetical protein
VFVIAKFLVPMWTILWVFQPVEGDTRNSEVALASRYNLVRCFTNNMGICTWFFVLYLKKEEVSWDFMHVCAMGSLVSKIKRII